MTEPDSRVSQMQHRSREISSMLCLTFQLDQNHGFCRLSHSEELQTKLIVLTRPSDQRSLRKSTGPQAMGCVKLFEASATASSLPRLPLRPARVEWFRPPGPTQKTRTQASRFHTHTHMQASASFSPCTRMLANSCSYLCLAIQLDLTRLSWHTPADLQTCQFPR